MQAVLLACILAAASNVRPPTSRGEVHMSSLSSSKGAVKQWWLDCNRPVSVVAHVSRDVLAAAHMNCGAPVPVEDNINVVGARD